VRRVVNKQKSAAVRFFSALSLPALFLFGWSATAQISVLTQHYDIGRTGANINETILTPGNVNVTQFGKLFSYPVDGYVYAQPLYVPNVMITTGPQAGSHNVVFVATENDSVYAFDADSNSAGNASPLWHITLLDAAHGAAAGARVMFSSDISNQTDIVPVIGITSTPVIDPATGRLYVVGKSKEYPPNDPTHPYYVLRLHALKIADGTEAVSPVQMQGSVKGAGTGSSGGTLKFDPYWQNQRPGLLLLNGIVYIGFGAHEDFGVWHGWILAYNAATLSQTGAWCSTPNGSDGGIWASGTGLAADVPDPTGHPFGRMFISTGNGSFNAVAPNYTNSMNYGDSIIKLDLAGGVPTMTSGGKPVGDAFTPFDQAKLSNADTDQGSGGTLLVPGSGTPHLLVQAGKSGRVYVVDQDSMGGYHPTNTSDPAQKATLPTNVGMWSAPAYWNGHVYYWGVNDHLRSWILSVTNGVPSLSSPLVAAEYSNFPGSTPVVSSNGTANGVNGIVWNILSQNFNSKGHATLEAHDTNTLKFLYSSDQNLSRDNPGNAVKFTVPTVANGKVYVGTEASLSVFGLLNGFTQAAAPVISPPGQSFTSSIAVTMSDSTPGTAIHYTTDGSTPTAASTTYTSSITVTTSETIRAIAIASGYLDSNITTNTYTRITQAAMPAFSPAPGTYSGPQQVTITSSTSGATIYYTTDGTTPTTASTKYAAPVSVSTTTTLKAIATAPNLSNSAVASGVYTIQAAAAARPSFSPAPGTYANPINLSINSTTAGATIYYTTDGTTPSTSSNKYAGPVPINITTTVKAIATAPNLANSGVSSATYTIQNGAAAAPTFNPAPGTYSSAQSVTISSTTSGASIYYTTDGSTPTTASTKYSAPVSITTTTTLKAIAVATGLANSPVTSGVYTIQTATAAAPTFSPPAGTYSSAQSVTISSTTSGASIYYTTDGSAPTTSSTKYSAPVSISTTTTLQGIATAAGFTNSPVTSGIYTIQAATAARPSFSPAPGTYTNPINVSLFSTTAGATMYYTTDGTTPTTASNQYTGPFTVSTTTTVKAIATAPNFANSSVSNAPYKILAGTAATPSLSPPPGTYTGAQQVTISSTTAGATIYYTTDGSTPTTTSNQYTGPVTVSVTETLKAMAVAPNYANSAVAGGLYTIN